MTQFNIKKTFHRSHAGGELYEKYHILFQKYYRKVIRFGGNCGALKVKIARA